MKKVLCVGLLLLEFTLVVGQNVSSSDSNKVQEFKNIVRTEFSRIVTGNGLSSIGNYLGLSSDSKTLTVGISKINKNSIWTGEFGGGANDGVLKVFNKGSINSNIVGELKYHFFLKLRKASRDAKNSIDRETKRIELFKSYAKDTFEIFSKIEYYRLKKAISTIEQKIKDGENSIKQLQGLIDSTSDTLVKNRLVNDRDLKKAELLLDKRDFEASIRKLVEIDKNFEKYFANALNERTFKYLQDLAEINKVNDQLLGFDVSWFTVGIRAKKDRFNLYYSGHPPDYQIRDTSFLSQRATFSFSRYYKSSSSAEKSVYYSLGVTVDYTSNLSTLDKINIEESQAIAGTNDRRIIKDIIAYVGDYKETIYDFSVYLDYLTFQGIAGQSIGLRFNPSLNYNSLINKPISNLSVGIVFPFIEKAKQTSRANLELFYFRQDIADYLKRSTKESFVGVRATFPISL